MGDLSCPACGLVLYGRGVERLSPRHCPRCIALSRRLVALVDADVQAGLPDLRVDGAAVRAEDARPARAKQRPSEQNDTSPFSSPDVATP
ncbi:MAG: hypothetical protein ABR946_03875 [Solirubrobacteraceae bacterium]|jgi:hypothetical protein